MAAGWRGRAALLMVAAMALAGCEDAPTPAAAPAPSPTAAAARPAAPGGIVLTPQPDTDAGSSPSPSGKVVLVNDPSAPADTPLCGTAARERIAIGQSLLPQQSAEAGICGGFACYDPATATYIGIDGYRHVCR